MTHRPHLHQIVEMAGGMLIGDRFLFSTEQLERFVRLASADTLALATLADRLERAGKKVVLTV